MSDIINSQPISGSFKEQNIDQEDIKLSFFSTDLMTSEDLKKLEQAHANHMP